ncbi:MAG: Rne/Rng family ribonuclease [Candidatus Riflebacteria bacterium]|nr:Rne/Rng family ribonuclease [Candidatus Riflebacteria bacterium]
MSRKILVNCGAYETRAVIIDDDQPFELFYEIPDSEKIVGCIFKGRVANVVPGTQSAFVDIGLAKDAYLTMTGVEGASGFEDEDLKEIYKSSIQDMLKVGQECVLQILKEPTQSKGPRSSMLISFPGRYLVLMPTHDQIGISRRISSESERDRLRAIGKKLLPKNMGLIFRTAAEGLEERELLSDLKILLKMWAKVEAKTKVAPMKSMIHRDLPLTLKLVRDYFTDEVEQFLIDSPEEHKTILEFCDFLSPLQRASLEVYQGPEPIFEKFGIESEIAKALESKVWLESGAYLIIERTEALVTIDVNSGRFSGGADLEETVFKVNLEAAKDIARQVRLRNLAGMIIIDFIDMVENKHRTQVVKVLRDAFKGDRNRPNLLDMSELGLVQMTRRRISHSLEEILKSSCPCCGGQRTVFSVSTIANRIRNQVMKEAARFEGKSIRIIAHRKVIEFFKADHESRRRELETRVSRRIDFVEGEPLEFETYKIEPILQGK